MEDQKRPESLLKDDLRKRIDEIDRSNKFNAQESQQYYTPRREAETPPPAVKKSHKDKKIALENRYSPIENFHNPANTEQIIRPRKKTFSPFSKEEQKYLSDSLADIKEKHETRERFVKREEKRLMKDQHRIIKKLNKYERKIIHYSNRGNQEEVEKTLEMKSKLNEQLKDIQESFKSITSSFTPEMSLGERRKKIYSNAYKAETNRVRKIVDAQKKESGPRAFGWNNHVNFTKRVMPDKDAALPERKREKSWNEEVDNKNKNQ